MPRIRTIKPEFWSHPIFGRAPDEVRLGALGLLNLADDEGYFIADAAAVRSFIWPFDEDSSKARRVLDNLARAGYIEVVEHLDRGPIGRVVKFSDHQRVDRPKSSTLKAYFSAKPRRTIDDESSLEGKGRDGKGREVIPPPDGGGQKPGLSTDPAKDEIWATGLALLEARGMTAEAGRPFLGRLVREYGQVLVLRAVRDCAMAKPVDPKAWLMARCQERRRPDGERASEAVRRFVEGERAAG